MKNFLLIFICVFFSNSIFAQTLHQNPNLAPFYHGVASGDPLTNQVIIWSRITPINLDENITVQWQVATDLDFTNVIAQGEYTTNQDRDFTIKIDVNGLLPNQYYYYQFIAPDGRKSMVGRTKTAPETMHQNLRFAGVSCSSIYSGYFNAYRRIAERNDIDAVIHIGDYIYDFIDAEEQIRVPEDSLLFIIENPDNKDRWRALHAYYKLDPDLRAAHQQHPWIILWDNHDLQDAVGNGEDEDAIASMEAFLEWTPVRLPNESEVNIIYRTLKYGDLLDIIIMDIDLFRDPQASNFDDIIDDPDRSILGEEQLNWLKNELLNSTAEWRLLCSSKPMGQWHLFGLPDILPIDLPGINDFGFPFTASTWDGYPYERQNIYEFLRENNINNNIAISGDLHTYFFYDMVENPWDPTLYHPSTGGQSVGAEFVPGSISRGNLDETLSGLGINSNQGFADFVEGTIRFLNPHNVYMDFVHHGYGILDFRPGKVTGEFWFNPILEPSETERFDASFTCFKDENRWKRARNDSAITAIYNGAEQPAFEMYTADEAETVTNVVNNSVRNKNYIFSEVTPNPTKGNATFSFTTSKERLVEICVYNLSDGRKIGTLHNGIMIANNTFIGQLSSLNLSAGSYSIIARGTDFVEMKKFVVY